MIEKILTFCKAQAIVSMDNKFDKDCYLDDKYDQQSYYSGELNAYNSVIVFINHLMDKKNESS